jgi:hypothetical protein
LEQERARRPRSGAKTTTFLPRFLPSARFAAKAPEAVPRVIAAETAILVNVISFHVQTNVGTASAN